MSVIFCDLWHTQPCRYETSLGSKVCFGSPYILAIAQLSWVSKELRSSGEPQKASWNLYEQHIKHQLQNNYCIFIFVWLATCSLLVVTSKPWLPPPVWMQIAALGWDTSSRWSPDWPSEWHRAHFWDWAARGRVFGRPCFTGLLTCGSMTENVAWRD